MKVQLVGPNSGWILGVWRRWDADEIVEVDDTDEAAVVGWRAHCARGLGTVLEEAKPSKPAPAPEEAGIVQLRAKAEQLGVKVDGRWSASRLEQEIAKAGKAKVE